MDIVDANGTPIKLGTRVIVSRKLDSSWIPECYQTIYIHSIDREGNHSLAYRMFHGKGSPHLDCVEGPDKVPWYCKPNLLIVVPEGLDTLEKVRLFAILGGHWSE
jgi:hypothetical protein